MLPIVLLALFLAGLVPDLAAAKRLGGTGHHFLVLQRDGQVFAVGRNNFGQLGLDTTTNAALPRLMLSVANATDVSAGNLHSCVLDQGGQFKSAGFNDNQQLRDGTQASRRTLVPAIDLASGIEEVQCGFGGSCARTASGAVQCWGYFAGLVRASPVPITVSGGVQSFSVGNAHACFVAVGGKLYCMGSNDQGRLGTGNTTSQTEPTAVVGLAAENIVSVACGERHTCAVNAAGAMFCWGSFANGRLGNPNITSDSPNPVQVLGITSGAATAWTGYYNSFALMRNGTVQAFGHDGYGVFGAGSTGQKTTAVVFGQGASGVVEVRGGFLTTCALFQDDQVWCTGDSQYGQLGVGGTTRSLTLVETKLRLRNPASSDVVALTASLGAGVVGAVLLW